MEVCNRWRVCRKPRQGLVVVCRRVGGEGISLNIVVVVGMDGALHRGKVA